MATPSFPDLVAQLAVKPDIRREPSHRRVRGLLGGCWVFDSENVEFVWEHEYYPAYYVPLKAIEAGPATVTIEKRFDDGYWMGRLSSGGKDADVVGFERGPLEGLIRILNNDIFSWYEEDEPLLGPHPRDPYKRIDCFPSSREVRVDVARTTVARSTNNIFLHETGLPVRYYVSPAAVLDWSLFTPSDTSTFCPYKGQASYYHLKVGKKVVQNVAWYYQYPAPESARIQSLLCFNPRKADIFVEGRPVTKE